MDAGHRDNTAAESQSTKCLCRAARGWCVSPVVLCVVCACGWVGCCGRVRTSWLGATCKFIESVGVTRTRGGAVVRELRRPSTTGAAARMYGLSTLMSFLAVQITKAERDSETLTTRDRLTTYGFIDIRRDTVPVARRPHHDARDHSRRTGSCTPEHAEPPHTWARRPSCSPAAERRASTRLNSPRRRQLNLALASRCMAEARSGRWRRSTGGGARLRARGGGELVLAASRQRLDANVPVMGGRGCAHEREGRRGSGERVRLRAGEAAHEWERWGSSVVVEAGLMSGRGVATRRLRGGGLLLEQLAHRHVHEGRRVGAPPLMGCQPVSQPAE